MKKKLTNLKIHKNKILMSLKIWIINLKYQMINKNNIKL